jgi:hypothetical protein
MQKDLRMPNTAIIDIDHAAAIAAYLGTTPARVATALTHPEVSRETKLFLLCLVPAAVTVQ